MRHIVLTHFDADHAGGLADFPWAKVHVTQAEHQSVLHPSGILQRGRYPRKLCSHGPDIVEHTPDRSESWHGFAGAEELTDVAPGLVLISLPGHSRGHAAVAVETSDGWILHVGDSFYHHGQIDGTGNVPNTLTAMERLVAADWTKVQDNRRRLKEVWDAAESHLVLVNAHDPTLLDRARSREHG